MKMKKLARVFTSAVLVSAMVATMGGMTSFAADKEIPLTKEVVTPTQTYVPTATYTFKLAVGEGGVLNPDRFDSDGFKGNTGYSSEVELLGGLEDGVIFGGSDPKETTISYISMTDEGTKTTGDAAWTYSKVGSNKIKVVESVFQAPGVNPGIYHYTIDEVSNAAEGLTNPVKGMTYDSRTKDIYVYVVNGDNGNNRVDNVIVVNPDGSKDGNNPDYTNNTNISTGVTFTNNFDGKNDENEDTFYDLTVKKIVTGNQGEKGVDFKFDLSVTGTGRDYYLTYGDANNALNTATAIKNEDNGSVSGINLRDGDSITIHNLFGEDIYNVEELQAELAGRGYTVKVATVNAEDGQKTSDLLNKTTQELVDLQKENGYKVENATNATGNAQMVVIENNKDVTTPTGIVLSFAPYILLVALAGVFGVLFLRRKKEEF